MYALLLKNLHMSVYCTAHFSVNINLYVTFIFHLTVWSNDVKGLSILTAFKIKYMKYIYIYILGCRFYHYNCNTIHFS